LKRLSIMAGAPEGFSGAEAPAMKPTLEAAMSLGEANPTNCGSVGANDPPQR
jgi:hypothetical protein